jgi:hypothetical protein
MTERTQTPLTVPLFLRLAGKLRSCDHDWRYDHEESQGPWTGYIESCVKCGAICQVPQ